VPLIKRYANRKLYDTRAKRYVTLHSLAELVRHGEDVRVVDHASGEDLTDLTLAQIIFKQEKGEKIGLPLVTLKAMIQASNQALAHLRSALPWPDSSPAHLDAEIQRCLGLLMEWGELTEEEAGRLTEQLAQAGRWLAEVPALDATTLERELRDRGVPSRAEDKPWRSS
jgi:polyhydroxyalkanoate synthesis repressor PhaR